MTEIEVPDNRRLQCYADNLYINSGDSGEPMGSEEMSSHSTMETIHDYLCRCWSIDTLKRKLPIIVWLPKYRLLDLQSDIVAGITVGLTVIPQGLAYARIAGLPPQHGLYSAFMGCFVYCLLGTSRDITLGPTAIMSLMTARFALSPIKQDPTIAIVLSLMVGIIQLAMGILNLGIIVNFISYPVINAFTSAAAITIAVGQVKGILGLKDIPRNTLKCIYWTFAKIKETNVWDCGMGLCCLIIIYFMKKLRTIHWPPSHIHAPLYQRVARKIVWLAGTGTNAIIVVAASLIVAVFDSQNVGRSITTCDNIKPGLPPFASPVFSLKVNGTDIGTDGIFERIGVGLLVVPVLGLVELIAIGHTFARKNQYRIDATQELVATGVANILSSFVCAYPVTGSFSRTAINSQSGSRTPGAGIYTGLLVLLALGVLSPLFKYIPIATLSGMIIVAVLPMVDVKILRDLWRWQKRDLVPWGITFIFSFILGIEYGILIGIGVSLLMLLYRNARPKVDAIGRHVTIITLSNGFEYPAADYVTEKITELSLKDDVCIIFDCRHIHTVDFTSLQAFVNIHRDLERENVPLVLLSLRSSIKCQLMNTGVNFKVASTLEEAHRICEETINLSEIEPVLRKLTV